MQPELHYITMKITMRITMSWREKEERRNIERENGRGKKRKREKGSRKEAPKD